MIEAVSDSDKRSRPSGRRLDLKPSTYTFLCPIAETIPAGATRNAHRRVTKTEEKHKCDSSTFSSAPLQSSLQPLLLPPAAAANSMYHSEHLKLNARRRSTAAAPVWSGEHQGEEFQGSRHRDLRPEQHQHTGDLHGHEELLPRGEKCSGTVFPSDVATLRTNASGNARGDAFISPADVVGFEGKHAVMWNSHHRGRCWEDGGAPAYWPWVELLRACMRSLEPAELRRCVGSGGPELAELLAEVRELLG